MELRHASRLAPWPAGCPRVRQAVATIAAQGAFEPSESSCRRARPAESHESEWSRPLSPGHSESWRPGGLLSCLA